MNAATMNAATMNAVLPVGIAGAWVALIGAFGWWHRPAGRLPASVGMTHRSTTSVVAAPSARRLLVLAVIAAGATVISFKLLVVAALVAFAEAKTRHRRDLRRRNRLVMVELPEIVDFYVVGLSAGLTVGRATHAIAHQLEGMVPAALSGVLTRTEHGARLGDELAALPDAVGDAVRPLTRVLVDAERHGVAIGDALDRLSQDVRLQRRRWAEIQARRIPVKLLFPLVFCTLPAFVLLSIANPMLWVTAENTQRIRRRLRDDAGQTTAEYALVLLGVAAIAMLLLAWARRTDTLNQLFDDVLASLRGLVQT